MKKKGKSKKKNNNLLFLTGFIVIIILIVLLVMIKKDNSLESELKKEGYSTENKDDAFYKKITTGNTLEEYYNDISNEKDSEYEEYYLSKESNDFIELKMSYKNKVNTTLNITMDLKTEKINFNYELTYENAHIILEGNSDENYDCKVIVSQNTKEDSLRNQCDNIMNEINMFIQRKNEFLTKNINNNIK